MQKTMDALFVICDSYTDPHENNRKTKSMNKRPSAALAGVLTAATVASAQNIQKADNTDPLNQTASW